MFGLLLCVPGGRACGSRFWEMPLRRSSRLKTRWPLRFRFVNDRTNRTYMRWVQYFLAWCEIEGKNPGDAQTLDDNVSQCIEHMYLEDGSVSSAGHLLAGLQHFCLLSPSQLKGAWRTFGAWKREKPSVSTVPLPQVVAQAWVVIAHSFGHEKIAAMMALAYHAYLRTSEFLDLRAGDVFCGDDFGIITLRCTKTSWREGGVETVVIDCPVTLAIVRQTRSNMHADDLFWNGSAQQFRKVFRGILAILGCKNMGFTLYSWRHGGASSDFERFGSLDRCMLRGRWKQQKTARKYIQLARITEASARLPVHCTNRCRALAGLLPLLPLGEDT